MYILSKKIFAAHFLVVALAALVLLPVTTQASTADLIYGYECRQSKCVKVELSAENFEKAISFPVCRLFCGDDIGTLWPKPTGTVRIESFMRHIDYANAEFDLPKYGGSKTAQLWAENKARFTGQVMAKIPDLKLVKSGGYPIKIVVRVNGDESGNKANSRLTLETDESYELKIDNDALKNEADMAVVLATIDAKTFYGARHGLETLAQLIVYDDIRREVQITAKVQIRDAPVYKWRGLLLDTARNFFSVKAIKRTLDAMAMVKLNTFHWHITDSHSFPMEMKSQPELYKLGAYSPRKVYTHADIADVVEYGRVRGIRVMPEFDAPAHVGEGWQHKDMTACFNAQPWLTYCVEPPCGQLDPTVDELYPVLEDIYREMFELFEPDVFHMGGDEVSVSCWNSSERIRNWMTTQQKWQLNEADFMRLWGHFQTKALERVDRVASLSKQEETSKPPIILWTSHLTDVPYIDDYLDRDRYIIQIWTTGMDPKVQDILKRGFRVIVSNYDALYFDCGNGGWVSDGNNWCSPYIGWQKVYSNDLSKIAGDYDSLVLGAEAAIWSEQIDETTVDARFWPRASALAERLWSNPQETWRNAEARLLMQRERMVENGISAEAVQPEWCLQNQNECPKDAYDAKND